MVGKGRWEFLLKAIAGRRKKEFWNSNQVGHLRCKWQPLLSEVAYQGRAFVIRSIWGRGR